MTCKDLVLLVSPEAWTDRPKVAAFRNWMLHEVQADAAQITRGVAAPGDRS
jgi:hypothetical protein